MNKLSDKCYSKYKDAYINALKSVFKGEENGFKVLCYKVRI